MRVYTERYIIWQAALMTAAWALLDVANWLVFGSELSLRGIADRTFAIWAFVAIMRFACKPSDAALVKTQPEEAS